jgi:uncharacterized cupin superfamily protein
VIDGGQLKRRLVTTGRVDAEAGRVEVLAGLDEQAQVLAGRYDNLREGTKATVVVPKATSAAAAQKKAG